MQEAEEEDHLSLSSSGDEIDIPIPLTKRKTLNELAKDFENELIMKEKMAEEAPSLHGVDLKSDYRVSAMSSERSLASQAFCRRGGQKRVPLD